MSDHGSKSPETKSSWDPHLANRGQKSRNGPGGSGFARRKPFQNQFTRKNHFQKPEFSSPFAQRKEASGSREREKEANAVAKQVMGQAKEEEEQLLSRKESSNDSVQLSPKNKAEIDSSRGGGQELPGSERSFFEPRFGHDFSNVRIHTDSKAQQLSTDINARAFTVGNNVFFGPEEYKPGTEDGRFLMAHELTHTLQQSGKQEGVQRKEQANVLENLKKLITDEILSPELLSEAISKNRSLHSSPYPTLEFLERFVTLSETRGMVDRTGLPSAEKLAADARSEATFNRSNAVHGIDKSYCLLVARAQQESAYSQFSGRSLPVTGALEKRSWNKLKSIYNTFILKEEREDALVLIAESIRNLNNDSGPRNIILILEQQSSRQRKIILRTLRRNAPRYVPGQAPDTIIPWLYERLGVVYQKRFVAQIVKAGMGREIAGIHAHTIELSRAPTKVALILMELDDALLEFTLRKLEDDVRHEYTGQPGGDALYLWLFKRKITAPDLREKIRFNFLKRKSPLARHLSVIDTAEKIFPLLNPDARIESDLSILFYLASAPVGVRPNIMERLNMLTQAQLRKPVESALHDSLLPFTFNQLINMPGVTLHGKARDLSQKQKRSLARELASISSQIQQGMALGLLVGMGHAVKDILKAGVMGATDSLFLIKDLIMVWGYLNTDGAIGQENYYNFLATISALEAFEENPEAFAHAVLDAALSDALAKVAEELGPGAAGRLSSRAGELSVRFASLFIITVISIILAVQSKGAAVMARLRRFFSKKKQPLSGDSRAEHLRKLRIEREKVYNARRGRDRERRREKRRRRRRINEEVEKKYRERDKFDQKLKERVKNKADEIIDAESNSKLRKLSATSKASVPGLNLPSPHFQNIFIKLSESNPVLRNIIDVDDTGGTFRIIDKDAFIRFVIVEYDKANDKLHPFTEKLIRKHIEPDRIFFKSKGGIPGLHAEVRAVNYIFNKLERKHKINPENFDMRKITVATFKLYPNKETQGKPFEACYNCRNIIPPEIRILTGRTTDE